MASRSRAIRSTAFAPAYSKDKYESTAWTLNGKIADMLSMVYTGSYMVRHIDGQQDYSNYMRSNVGSYYACIGTGRRILQREELPEPADRSPAAVLDRRSATGATRCATRTRAMSCASPPTQDWRVRGLAGFYWEKFVIDDNMNFNYLGIPQCDQAALNTALNGGADCLSAVGPVPGAYASDPSLRTNANTAFGEDVQRGYKQKAFFTSIDVDIIPKVLVATGGIRFYHYDEFEEGSEYYSESTSGSFSPSGQGLVVNHLNGQCTAAGLCGFPMALSKSESGHRWRGNLTWNVTNDVMGYYTYSEGFRPGGFNRTATTLDGSQVFLKAVAPYLANGTRKQFYKPAGYELGPADQPGGRYQVASGWTIACSFNVSGYVMHWSNVQLSLFDPVHLGNTTFDVNGPEYKIKGFEVQFVARLMEGLTWEGSTSVNSSEQVNGPCLPSNIPASVTGNPTPLGAVHHAGQGAAVHEPLRRERHAATLLAAVDVQHTGSLRVGVRRLQAVRLGRREPHGTDEQRAGELPERDRSVAGVPTTTLLRYDIPSYTMYDAAIGVSKDNWNASIIGNNITNVYGPSNISSGQFIQSQIPLRPRVITFQFGFKF